MKSEQGGNLRQISLLGRSTTHAGTEIEALIYVGERGGCEKKGKSGREAKYGKGVRNAPYQGRHMARDP